MEFQQVVDRRRMIRNYADRPVDPGAVQRALRNATRAPSAGFSQGWAFVLLDEPGDVSRYWEATTDPAQLAEPDSWLSGMLRAPVVVIPCSSKAAYVTGATLSVDGGNSIGSLMVYQDKKHPG